MKIMAYDGSLVTVTILSLSIIGTFSQESCMSVNRAPGKCVTFEECPVYLAILKSPKITGGEIRLLQKLTCNFENPKICCPLQQVVSRYPGAGDTTSFNLRHPTHPHTPSTQHLQPPSSSSTTPPTNSGEPDWNVFLSEEETGQTSAKEQSTENKPDSSTLLFTNHPNFHLFPDLSSCGNVRSIDNIVGGQDASHGGHPWIARIGYRNIETNEVDFYCSGTIISKRYKQAGRTKWNSAEGSTTLQEVFLPLISNEECQSRYSTRAKISEKQMCAGGIKGRDSCSGDSGGPYLLPVNIGTSGLKFFQLGVVSFGPVQCGIGGLPGVYSRVTSYFEWILNNMEP